VMGVCANVEVPASSKINNKCFLFMLGFFVWVKIFGGSAFITRVVFSNHYFCDL